MAGGEGGAVMGGARFIINVPILRTFPTNRHIKLCFGHIRTPTTDFINANGAKVTTKNIQVE